LTAREAGRGPWALHRHLHLLASIPTVDDGIEREAIRGTVEMLNGEPNDEDVRAAVRRKTL